MRAHRAIRSLSPRLGKLAAELLTTMLERLPQEQRVAEMQLCDFTGPEARTFLAQHGYIAKGLVIPVCAHCDGVIDPSVNRRVYFDRNSGRQWCEIGCWLAGNNLEQGATT